MQANSNLLETAARILGVEVWAAGSEIRYSYYRLMTMYHPDKNPGDPEAQRLSALINEARDILLGKETRASLIKDPVLVSQFLNTPVEEGEVLSYNEWLKSRFYDIKGCSIWPG